MFRHSTRPTTVYSGYGGTFSGVAQNLRRPFSAGSRQSLPAEHSAHHANAELADQGVSPIPKLPIGSFCMAVDHCRGARGAVSVPRGHQATLRPEPLSLARIFSVVTAAA